MDIPAMYEHGLIVCGLAAPMRRRTYIQVPTYGQTQNFIPMGRREN